MLQVRSSSAERRMHRLLERYASRVWSEAGARHDSCAQLVSIVLRKRALSSAWALAHSVSRRATLLDAGSKDGAESQLRLPLGEDDAVDDEVSDAALGAVGLADAAAECGSLREIESAAKSALLSETKTAFLVRLLRRAGEPAIVFTEYRDTLLHVERKLRGAGFDPILLHGGMPAGERASVQRAFNQRGSVLLATDAASEGLNLHTRCRLVVHFELPWTPARLEQRTGRVDRLGQQRRVHEVLLVSRHRAERLVLAQLVRRARVARQRSGQSRGAAAFLTESQIAGAMMGVAYPECEDLPPPEGRAMVDVREDAIAEAERVAFRRRIRPNERWCRGCSSRPPAARAAVFSCTWRASRRGPAQ